MATRSYSVLRAALILAISGVLLSTACEPVAAPEVGQPTAEQPVAAVEVAEDVMNIKPVVATYIATLPPEVSPFIFTNWISGRCLDVQGSPGVDNEAPLQLWDCEDVSAPSNDQVWVITSDGFIQNQRSGKCIDVWGTPGIDNELILQLWDCEFADPYNSDQRWELTSDGFLRNLLSGKCIDARGTPGTENGTPLQLWDCEYSDPSYTDQRWELKRAPQGPEYGLYINDLVLPHQIAPETLASVRQSFLSEQVTKVNDLDAYATDRNQQFANALGGMSLNWNESQVAYRDDAGKAVPEVIMVPVQSSDPQVLSAEGLEKIKESGVNQVVLGGMVLLDKVSGFDSGIYIIEWNPYDDAVNMVNPITGASTPMYCEAVDYGFDGGVSVEIHNYILGCINVKFLKRQCCL